MSVERAIDRTLAAWVRRRTGSDILSRAAACVSRDEALGHSCAMLGDDMDFSAADITELHRQPWVGDGTRFAPFVLAANGSCYSWRNWQHEARLSASLRARAGRVSTRTDVDDLFTGTDPETTREQRAAVAAVEGSRLLVVTGGPGTGKTSTAMRMIAMAARCADRAPSVALAAPTGKAAQRLTEAVAASRARLLEELPADSPFRTAIDTLPALCAQTLHRLLDYRPHENAFARNADSPIAADLIVVDETSMVDLAMMRQLFDAVRDDAQVILLGDPRQLYAVEAGSVLGDIVTSAEGGGALAENVVPLTRVWRAQSGLHAALDALRGGDHDWADALLATQGDDAVGYSRCTDAASLKANVERWIGSHANVLQRLLIEKPEPAEALRLLRHLQILCALRETPFGSVGVNALVTRTLAQRFGVDATSPWYPGRPVIVTRNDYARGLFNGDVGVALRDEFGIRVWFETADRSGQPILRSFSARSLAEHETAWAITIHRSQGSEYGRVAVVLPPDAAHRILSRELLYTAVSRATHRVELWSAPDALRAAIGNPIRRHGGLRQRLR
jgi:exodeoxyribonuclease V alpha subunit